MQSVNKKGNIGILLLAIIGIAVFYIFIGGVNPLNNGGDEGAPICGNLQCQAGNGVDEFLSCPSDCGIICGDDQCTIAPYNEQINCPQDCDTANQPDYCRDGTCDNNENPPVCGQNCGFTLVGGLKIEHERDGGSTSCTLGMIVTRENKEYILTAGHCITKGSDGMPDSPNDIGLWVKYNGKLIGHTYDFDDSGGIDAALISINPDIPRTTYLDLNGNTISGFTNPTEGMEVYKIGFRTGLTYGTITDISLFYSDKQDNRIRGFEVTGKNGEFSTFGDSGSAIITVSTPHKLVGIISAGSGSNWGLDIKRVLDID